MAFIGTFSRALLDSATAVYYGGNPVTVLDSLGNVVVGDTPPAPPTISGTIADRVYEIGSGPYTIDLATKFSGAGTYVVSPPNANLSLSGAILTITPTAALAQTTISVVGRNGGGDSPALTFKLAINAAAPTVTTPLPDQSLNTGSANVTIPLDSHFSGVATYTVSPAGQGATISGRNLVLSTASARSLEITVTGANSTGQSVSDTFLFAVAQLQQAPAVTSIPTLSGSATVGGILTRTAGTATGIPAPSRATRWLLNGTEEANIIPGQTGNTLDTSGFAAGDVIRTRDVWTNTIGGVVQTATGTSDPVTLTLAVVLEINATVSPDPLQSGKPASITFDIEPENVGGSVTLTDAGDGLTFTFMVPESGTVLISAATTGYEPFQKTYTIDTETIEAVIVPVETATYAGQTIGDIPNIATIIEASNYVRAGRTINPPQLRRNGQAATLSTKLAKGDIVDVLVTDNLGGSETFLLSTTQYAVQIAVLEDGLYRALDDNPLLPDDLPLSVPYLGKTTITTQAELASGPVSHIHVKLTKTEGVYAFEPGMWFSTDPGPTNLTHRLLRNESSIPFPHTHVSPADDTATFIMEETATDASGTRTQLSNAIVNVGANPEPEPTGEASSGPVLVDQVYFTADSAATRTIFDRPIGLPDPRRGLILGIAAIGSTGQLSDSTVLELLIGAETIVAERITVAHSQNATNPANTTAHVGWWQVRGVTAGELANFRVTGAAGSFALGVFRGIEMTISDFFAVGGATADTTLTAALDTARPGDKVLGLYGGASTGTVAWSGMNEFFDQAVGTRQVSFAEGVATGAAFSTTVTLGGSGQKALALLSAGATA